MNLRREKIIGRYIVNSLKDLKELLTRGYIDTSTYEQFLMGVLVDGDFKPKRITCIKGVNYNLEKVEDVN